MHIPLQQHPYFATTLRRLGSDCTAQPLNNAAQLQVITRFGLRFASRGPIWDTDNIQAQTAALKSANLRIINDEHSQPQALHNAGFRQLIKGQQVAELTLQTSLDTQMHRKWRYAYRQAARADMKITCEKFDPKKHTWLLQADSIQQKQKRYRPLPHSFIATFPDAQVWTATQNTPIAAIIILRHAPTATYHLAWANDTGRELNAHRLLLVRAAIDLQTNYQRLDLGPLSTPGIAQFKRGSGAHIRTLGGTWIRPPGF